MKFFKEIGRNAFVDWIILLFISIALFLVLAIGGVYLYNAVVHGKIQGTGAQSSVSSRKINEKAISSVVEELERREDISRKAASGYAGYGDPWVEPEKK